jgi:Pyruvate/2-oxoacid:ferredoxin oxidoreductase gamma subunit
MITEVKESKAKQIGFPFTDIARGMGNVAVANIIALGVIIKLTDILKEESIICAIEGVFKEKPKIMELNVKALRKGIELADIKI